MPASFFAVSPESRAVPGTEGQGTDLLEERMLLSVVCVCVCCVCVCVYVCEASACWQVPVPWGLEWRQKRRRFQVSGFQAD